MGVRVEVPLACCRSDAPVGNAGQNRKAASQLRRVRNVETQFYFSNLWWAGDDGMSEAQERRVMERQAQQLLEEIRRRMGERDRSKPERDYLERVLEKF